jgi:hypothetical protein
MIRYLGEEQLKTNLRLGKSIEQWLSTNRVDNYSIIKWLTIEKEMDGVYNVAYIESFDEGNEDFIDIYEFSTIDPDEPHGIVNTFNSVEEALKFSIITYGASSDKFVSAGMIQEEYRDYSSFGT